MAFDRKPGGFGGNKGSGGFRSGGGRPPFRKAGFGGPRRDDSRPPQMFSATCANCGNATEVPFRPDGSRPIYCRDCFAKQDGRGDAAPRRDAPRFERRDRDAAPRAAAPDKRIDELMREVASLGHKLDALVKMVGQMVVAKGDAIQQTELSMAVKRAVKKTEKKSAKQEAKKPAKKTAKK